MGCICLYKIYCIYRINHNLLPYVRLLLEDEGEGIYAVDPPGGPFISVGSKARSYIIKEIKQTSMGIFLRMEKGD